MKIALATGRLATIQKLKSCKKLRNDEMQHNIVSPQTLTCLNAMKSTFKIETENHVMIKISFFIISFKQR